MGEQYSSRGITYVLNPSIKIEVFFEIKIFFNKNKRSFALAITEEMWSVEFIFELKLIPRSTTSEMFDKFTPASSNFEAIGSFCLFVTKSHFDFSVEIGSCQVSAHFLYCQVSLERVSLKDVT